jgi:hypothetical protein
MRWYADRAYGAAMAIAGVVESAVGLAAGVVGKGCSGIVSLPTSWSSSSGRNRARVIRQ